MRASLIGITAHGFGMLREDSDLTPAAYYECHCGFYHVVGHTGGCDDDATRFISEELDEKHGAGEWDEIFDEIATSPATPIARHKNYDRMMALTPETDLDGRQIEVGCRVRCFSASYYDPENDWLMGMDTVGKTAYLEGRVIEIAEHTPSQWTPGIYYSIEIDREVAPVIERTRSDFTARESRATVRTGQTWFPANGTLIQGIRVQDGVFIRDPEAMDTKSFGVLRIT